jgi:hypothetical protein
LIGDVAKINVWTCASYMTEGKTEKSGGIPSSCGNVSGNEAS